jgi:hypothetical protein
MALSKHSEITYLNERRDLWFSAYPETDIWTKQATHRKGRIVLTGSDENSDQSSKLRELFLRETELSQRPILVEKLPINNFRLRFIQAIFPDARFVHIYRNGLEVARSIQEMCNGGKWFAAGQYKWEQLALLAQARDETATLPALCTNYYDQGLLEWRLSTEAAVDCLSTLSEDRYLEFSYADFINDPLSVILAVLSFIGIGGQPAIEEFVKGTIRRNTPSLDGNNLSDKEIKIGGKLLSISMASGKGVGLTSSGLHRPLTPNGLFF